MANQDSVDQLAENIRQMSVDEDVENGDQGVDSGQMEHGSDLPDIIIVTNVDDSVFENEQAKAEFESLFRKFDDQLTFQYLKSFRRARIYFTSALSAARARIQLHCAFFGAKEMKCYFAQPKDTPPENSSPHLRPPKPDKQFLISPPASPPVGWEPVHEGEPVINYDLLTAIANLAPGEPHELHPPSQNHPGIVVHICEDPDGFEGRPKIIQTRCPDR